MEAVIFTGLQASGKSTFYARRFFDTHIRINLDMLKNRGREGKMLDACLAAGVRFVVDNTNPTPADRARYTAPAKEAGFRVIGYYFGSDLEGCKRRNAERPEGKRIPLPGIMATRRKLVPPGLAEGLDELHYVSIDARGEFVVGREEKKP